MIVVNQSKDTHITLAQGGYVNGKSKENDE